MSEYRQNSSKYSFGNSLGITQLICFLPASVFVNPYVYHMHIVFVNGSLPSISILPLLTTSRSTFIFLLLCVKSHVLLCFVMWYFGIGLLYIVGAVFNMCKCEDDIHDCKVLYNFIIYVTYLTKTVTRQPFQHPWCSLPSYQLTTGVQIYLARGWKRSVLLSRMLYIKIVSLVIIKKAKWHLTGIKALNDLICFTNTIREEKDNLLDLITLVLSEG